MKLPLHIRPDDRSAAAHRARLTHYLDMAKLNPAGFRTRGAANRQGTGKTKRAHGKPSMGERLAALADLA